ncbi:hypothetical protein [Lysinibacillus xylanilyticus]|uniref:hypothetical protein n=1 Tax=Lysinibacillus xylanilyticus TaxID=582475 RepID=UPI003D040814
MWGWGEILSGFIAIFILIFGILYSKEDHGKYRNEPVSGGGTLLDELFAAVLQFSPYYVLKVIFILFGIFILVCIVISKM